MAEESTVQPAQIATPAEPVSTVPATPQAPETQPPIQPTVPAGPTAEQLAAELSEARQLISQANERASRAEHEVTYTRNLIEQGFGRGKPTAEAAPEIPQVTDDEFLTNPAKATARIIEGYRAIDKVERDKRDREQYIDRARSQFETGRKTATSQPNKLIQGIENEIASEIQQGVISGAINPEAATDADLWNVTALAYRYKVRGERNFDKYLSSTPSGMTSGHQETPTASTPPKAVPNLTDEEKSGARFFGVTDEQWVAAKRTEGK